MEEWLRKLDVCDKYGLPTPCLPHQVESLVAAKSVYRFTYDPQTPVLDAEFDHFVEDVKVRRCLCYRVLVARPSPKLGLPFVAPTPRRYANGPRTLRAPPWLPDIEGQILLPFGSQNIVLRGCSSTGSSSL